jgi:CRISPR-associated protein Csb1
MKELTLKDVQDAVAGTAAAFRCVTQYQPVGGEGDKVFPPTYEGGKYAEEKRRVPGVEQPVDCVLLDSVQSQANRMELALLDAWERARGKTDGESFPLPVLTVDFGGKGLAKSLRITSLEAPHRIADALLRDSLYVDPQLLKEADPDKRLKEMLAIAAATKPKSKDKEAVRKAVAFRESEVGKLLDHVDNKNATALFQYCPTTMVFGMWDSTGPRGGLGAKFARALVSEMVGIAAVVGVRTSSRIDPAQVALKAGPLYQAKDGGWTLDESKAAKDKGKALKLGKDGKPSEANHGNVTPTIEAGKGGTTLMHAIQTTVLSLPALRRLRFPINEKTQPSTDDAARTVLAALGLCAATLARESGCDLRSRCQLHPTEATEWELLDKPGNGTTEGKEFPKFTLFGVTAKRVYREAVAAAKNAGLPWLDDELVLTPSPQLVELVRRSQALAVGAGEGDQP